MTDVYLWETYDKLGREALERRDFEQAEEAYRGAVSLAEEFSPGDARLSLSLRNLAATFTLKGHLSQAHELLKKTLEVTREWFEDEEAEVLDILRDLAAVTRKLGFLDQSEGHLRALLDLARRANNLEDTEEMFDSLATLAQERGQSDRAAELFEEVVTRSQNRLGSDHPKVAQAKLKLSTALFGCDKAEEGETQLNDAFQSFETQFAGEPVDLALSLLAGADLMVRAGRLEGALVHQKRALDLLVKKLPSDDAQIWDAREQIANSLAGLGKLGEAIELLEYCLENRSQKDDHRAGGLTKNLAGLYLAKQNVPKAESLYQKAADILEKTLGNDHLAFLATQEERVQLYHFTGQPARALNIALTTISATENRFGAGHPNTAQAYASTAVLAHAALKWDTALELMRAAEKIWLNLRPVPEDVLANCRTNMATCLVQQRKLEEAQSMVDLAAENAGASLKPILDDLREKIKNPELIEEPGSPNDGETSSNDKSKAESPRQQPEEVEETQDSFSAEIDQLLEEIDELETESGVPVAELVPPTFSDVKIAPESFSEAPTPKSVPEILEEQVQEQAMAAPVEQTPEVAPLAEVPVEPVAEEVLPEPVEQTPEVTPLVEVPVEPVAQEVHPEPVEQTPDMEPVPELPKESIASDPGGIFDDLPEIEELAGDSPAPKAEPQSSKLFDDDSDFDIFDDFPEFDEPAQSTDTSETSPSDSVSSASSIEVMEPPNTGAKVETKTEQGQEAEVVPMAEPPIDQQDDIEEKLQEPEAAVAPSPSASKEPLPEVDRVEVEAAPEKPTVKAPTATAPKAAPADGIADYSGPDRRVDTRTNIKLNQFFDLEVRESGNSSIRSFFVDISRGGMRINSEKPFPKGTALTLKLPDRLLGESTQINTSVAWQRSLYGTSYIQGLQFDALTERQQELIDDRIRRENLNSGSYGRQHFRLYRPVKIQIHDAEEEFWNPAYASDLSLEGLGTRLPQAFQEGQELRIRLMLDFELPTVEVRAVVAWNKEAPKGIVHGLRFEKVGRVEARTIKLYIDRCLANSID